MDLGGSSQLTSSCREELGLREGLCLPRVTELGFEFVSFDCFHNRYLPACLPFSGADFRITG